MDNRATRRTFSPLRIHFYWDASIFTPVFEQFVICPRTGFRRCSTKAAPVLSHVFLSVLSPNVVLAVLLWKTSVLYAINLISLTYSIDKVPSDATEEDHT